MFRSESEINLSDIGVELILTQGFCEAQLSIPINQERYVIGCSVSENDHPSTAYDPIFFQNPFLLKECGCLQKIR